MAAEDMNLAQENSGDTDDLLSFKNGLTDEKVVAKLKSWNSDWDQFGQTHYPSLSKWWEMYRGMGYNIKGTPTKLTQVYVAIETILPHLVNNLYANTYLVDGKPKTDIDPTTVYKANQWINALLKNMNHGRKKAELIFKNLLIYGYSVVKSNWDLNPTKKVDTDKFLPDGITPNPNLKKVVTVNSAHPNFNLVDNYSFGWDPGFEGQNVNDIPWVRERIEISKNDMKQMRDNGECAWFDDRDMLTTENKGKIARDVASKKTKSTYYDEFWCTLHEEVPITEKQPVMHPETGMPQIDPMTGQMMTEDVETGETRVQSGEYRVWLLSNNKIIKFEENMYGYKPYSVIRCVSNPFEFTGVGFPELMESIAPQLSKTNYQAGAMVSKLGTSVTFIDQSAGIGPKNVNRFQQGIVFVKNLNGIKSEQSFDPQNVEVLIKFIEYLKTDCEDITGVTKTLQGTDVGDMSATQASLIAQNSTNRLANILTHLQEDFAVDIAEKFYMMSKQMLTEPISIIDNNNNMLFMTEDDFSGEYVWSSVSPVTLSNKSLQLQQNTATFGQLDQASKSSIGTPFAWFFNQAPYIEKHIAPNTSIPDIKDYVIPAGEVPGYAPTGQPLPPPMPMMPPQGPQGGAIHNVPQGSPPAGQPPQASGTPPQIPSGAPQVAGNPPQQSNVPMGSPPLPPHPHFSGK